MIDKWDVVCFQVLWFAGAAEDVGKVEPIMVRSIDENLVDTEVQALIGDAKGLMLESTQLINPIDPKVGDLIDAARAKVLDVRELLLEKLLNQGYEVVSILSEDKGNFVDYVLKKLLV